jgi:hypothetical protein
MSRQTGLLSLAVGAFFAFLPGPLTAQTTFATITGTVVDASGSVVSGIRVTATNVETNIQTTAVSNEAGVYTLAQIKEGEYILRAQGAGFKEFVAEKIVLLARDYRRVDIRLEVGNVESKIEVTAGATLIETETARLSDSKTDQDLKSLPLNTRSLWSFMALSPNVLSAGYGLSYRRFAGSRGNQGDAAIDGISLSTAYDGSQISPLVSYIESYQELRVDMANNSAEYGAIGQVTVISKSGTNQLHGSVFDYYTTPVFRARNPFALERSTGIGHQPGGSVGGPIFIPKIYNGQNKSFFFFDLETARGSANQDLLNPTVPLQSWRNGDFSALASSGTIVKDPFSGAPFPNNQIAASRLSPVSQMIQTLFYPLPNFGASSVFASQNYRELKIRPYDPSTYLMTRIDHRFSDKAFVYGRFTWNDQYSRQYLGNLPTIGRNYNRRDTRGGTVSFTYNIRSNLVNEFRTGVSFNNNPQIPPVDGLAIARQLGLQGLVNNLPDIPGMLHVSFTGLGLTAIDQGSSYNYRSPGNREFNYTFQDLLSWFRGRHSVKAGLFVNPHFHADKSTDTSLFGNVTFSNRYTGFPYADFLLGIPTTMTRAFPPIGYKRHWLDEGLFITDDFKITQQLTLNIGVRYQHKTNFTEANGRQAIFVPSIGKIVVPDGSLSKVSPLLPTGYVGVVEAKTVGLPNTLINPVNDVAPRIGLAYRPWGNNTVFRAGFGIFYDMVPRGAPTEGGVPFLINEPAYTNPTVPNVIFPQVFPATPLGPTTVSLPSAVNTSLRDPYSMQYNFTIEHQRWNTGFRISYIGTNTRQGLWSYNINQPLPDSQLYINKARLFPNYPAISYLTNGAGHQYNALTLTLERRMLRDLHYQFSYSLARDIGDIDLGQSPENAYDRQRERAVWADIPTHRVTGNVIYELPFGKGKHFLSAANPVVQVLAGGWELSAIYSKTSGDFLTPQWTGPDPTGTAYTTSATPPTVTLRPNCLADANLSQRSPSQWFNIAAFSPPALGSFGSCAKGVIKGPGTNQVDAGLAKYIPLRERIGLRWEMTATNLLNHPQWSDPDTNISDRGQVGVISAAGGTHSLDQPGPRAFRMGIRLEW